MRALAVAVSSELIDARLATATCLLGSVARKDTHAGSDVDLLVITERPVHQSELLSALSPRVRDKRLSLIPRTQEGWLAASMSGSLFVLHARLEGHVVDDRSGWLSETFAAGASIPPDVDGELARQRRRLRVFDRLERFDGRYLFVLSDLYSIGKAAAIAHCVDCGEPTFVKQRALRRVGDLKQHLAPDAACVARLHPFYACARGRTAPLPRTPDHDVAPVLDARAAVAALVNG